MGRRRRHVARMNKPKKVPAVRWGPCCFCGKDVQPTAEDPCRVTVETASAKWQVWFCHAACFKERIAPDAGADLSPAHF